MTQMVKTRWGYWEELHREPGVRIKKLVIFPGKSISFQYHMERDEHWTIISGQGRVIIDEATFLASRGIYTTFVIKKLQRHKITNEQKEGTPGASNLVAIEVQVGDYLEEDDIVRLELIDE